MKITPSDYIELETLLAPLASSYRQAVIDRPYHTPMRLRWDLLWSLPYADRAGWFDRVYKYANDTHIDTALRSIVSKF